jgi:hypothetical protein
VKIGAAPIEIDAGFVKIEAGPIEIDDEPIEIDAGLVKNDAGPVEAPSRVAALSTFDTLLRRKSGPTPEELFLLRGRFQAAARSRGIAAGSPTMTRSDGIATIPSVAMRSWQIRRISRIRHLTSSLASFRSLAISA